MNKIEEKKAEIERYKGILKRYGTSRWYDQGRRHLEELEAELEVMMRNSDANKGE